MTAGTPDAARPCACRGDAGHLRQLLIDATHHPHMTLVVTRKTAEPALDVDFFEACFPAVEPCDGLQVIECPVDEVVFGGRDSQVRVVAVAAEASAHECPAALGEVRPLLRRQCERLRAHIRFSGVSSVGDEDAGVLRQARAVGKAHAYHSGVRQLYFRQRSGHVGGNALQQQCRSRRGHGEDDVVVECVFAAGQLVLGRGGVAG